MRMDVLVAQVTANAPECPAYRINGFLLEFLEQFRLVGQQSTITLDNSTWDEAQYSIPIPDDVITVHDVYVNGRICALDLTEAEAVHPVTSANTDNYCLADPDDEYYLADYDDALLEIK